MDTSVDAVVDSTTPEEPMELLPSEVENVVSQENMDNEPVIEPDLKPPTEDTPILSCPDSVEQSIDACGEPMDTFVNVADKPTLDSPVVITAFSEVAKEPTFLEPELLKLKSNSILSKSSPINVAEGTTTSSSPFIEEDTRSSFTDQPSKPTSPTVPPPEDTGTPSASNDGILGDGDSKSSTAKKRKTLRCADAAIAQQVTARKQDGLYDYEWPIKSGDFWIIQDNLSDFIDVKNLKRKYPDMFRRNVDAHEREFVKTKQLVTDMQCDLGLVALRTQEVMELLQKDYPEKYTEFIAARKERAKKLMAERKSLASQGIDKSKMAEYCKKAKESAFEYNYRLNQERYEERRCIFDLQTYTLLYPANRRKVFVKPKLGKYPVAIIPGQYQDYYRTYTPHELKYLPLGTVLYGPPKEINQELIEKLKEERKQAGEEESEGSDSDASCDGSHDGDDDGSDSGESSASEKTPVDPTGMDIVENHFETTEDRKFPCRQCEKDTPGLMFRCKTCNKWSHYICLDLPEAEPDYLKKYNWQCMDCKVCFVCERPDNEEQMICCDQCDRGHHSFCVGLQKLPLGGWTCRHCGECFMCGVYKPDWYTPDETAQWIHEYKRGPVAYKDKRKSYNTFCTKCRAPKTKKQGRQSTAGRGRPPGGATADATLTEIKDESSQEADEEGSPTITTSAIQIKSELKSEMEGGAATPKTPANRGRRGRRGRGAGPGRTPAAKISKEEKEKLELDPEPKTPAPTVVEESPQEASPAVETNTIQTDGVESNIETLVSQSPST